MDFDCYRFYVFDWFFESEDCMMCCIQFTVDSPVVFLVFKVFGDDCCGSGAFFVLVRC